MRSFLTVIGVALGVAIVALISTSWVVVYVHDKEEGLRLLIPAPLFLADMALQASGALNDEIDLPSEVQELLPMLQPIAAELSEAPDCELLRVEQQGQDISIRKADDFLLINIADGDDRVRIKAPLAALRTAARAAADGRVQFGELTASLREASRVKLVDVSQPGQDLQVWVW